MTIIIEILGYLGLVLIAFYLFTGIYFLIFKKFIENKETKECGIKANDMPILRPLPIPTKPCENKTRWILNRTVIWIFKIRRWRLEENWEYKLPNGKKIILHKGFEFDGASVPRLFWAILSPVGLLLIQGIIHDYGYRYQQLWQIKNGKVIPYKKNAQKKEWDQLFKEIGREVNGMAFIDNIAYLGVRLFGCLAWGKTEQLVKPVLQSNLKTVTASLPIHREA